MSCRFQPDYRGDADFRGIAALRTEPCLDFTFDITVGLFIPAPTIPNLIPMDGFKPLACGGAITGLSISDTSPNAFYRTTDYTANQGYKARFFTIQASDEGSYAISLGNVSGFTPYVTVNRSPHIQWQGVLTNGLFEFSVSSQQTGPMIVEVCTLNRHESGAFDILLICPGDTVITVDSYVGNVGWPYRYRVTGGNDDSLPGSAVAYFYSDLPDPVEWVITDGSLPPGLSVNSATGLISGTPSAAGDYPFTVKVRKDGIFRKSKSSVFKVRPMVKISEISALITWINTQLFEGLPVVVNSFSGILGTGPSGYEEGEENWVWLGKGFILPILPDLPAGFLGMTAQVNNGLPRTISLSSYAFNAQGWTKSDMSPGVTGTYNYDGVEGAPASLTIVNV